MAAMEITFGHNPMGGLHASDIVVLMEVSQTTL